MLNFIVTVIQLIIFDLKRHELLLYLKVVIQLLLQLSYLNLLPRYHCPLIKYLLLNRVLIVLEVYRFSLVPCDHLPKLTAAVVIQEK
jgi:hypothetical protein